MKTKRTTGESAAKLRMPVDASDHHRGSLSAPLQMVEYGDFECPHCAWAFPEIEEIIEKHTKDLCFVYRHFPLSNIHPHAMAAALASEAAARQGQFWKMHHLLFATYGNLSHDTILTLAADLNLDLGQFATDLKSVELEAKVERDFLSGARSGVNGTPTIYLNGERMDIPVEYESYAPVLRSLIKNSENFDFY